MRDYRWKAGVCALGTVGAVALGACGGGEEDDFTAQANEICETSSRDITAVFAQKTETSDVDPEATQRQGDEANEVRSAAQEDLQALEPPDDVQADFDEYLDQREQVIAGVAEQAEALGKNDQKAAEQSAAEIDAAAQKAEDAAERAGLDVCAGVLPEEDVQAVEDVITTGFTSDDPDELKQLCTEQTTENLLEILGGLKKCEKPDPAASADSVDITEVKGVEDVTASAIFTVEGGGSDGQTLQADLVYEDGAYKADFIQQAPLGAG